MYEELRDNGEALLGNFKAIQISLFIILGLVVPCIFTHSNESTN